MAEVTCEELERMVAIKVPDEVILETIAADSTRNEDDVCVGRLPEAVRSVWLSLSITPPTVVSEPAPVVAPVPPPVPIVVGASMSPIERRKEIALVYQLPDPGQATALAGLVGFGAGHMHGGCEGSAAGFAVLDTAGAVVVASAGSGALTRERPEDTVLVVGVAAVVASLIRVGEIATAGPCARATALSRLGVE